MLSKFRLELAIDLPDGRLGDEVIEAHSAAGVICRPLVDDERSEFTDTDRAREYTKPHVRAFLLASTDAKQGWPSPTIEYDDGERAAPAPVVRRRRFIL